MFTVIPQPKRVLVQVGRGEGVWEKEGWELVTPRPSSPAKHRAQSLGVCGRTEDLQGQLRDAGT